MNDKLKLSFFKPGLVVFLIATIYFSNKSVAQSFVDINAGLTGVTYSSADWGDFDNDQDFDLVVMGSMAPGSYRTKIYRNDNGTFNETGDQLAGMEKGSVKWGDYDNDNDLDILLVGNNLEEKTFIYKNESGAFVSVDPGFYFAGSYSNGTWGDYDNDGDLDVFLSGNWNGAIYRNDGNDQFVETGNTIAMLSSTSSYWGDPDRDGDLDILLTGDTGGGMKTFLYTNNGGSFDGEELPVVGLSGGSIEWGDYDNDGDLDILSLGFNDYVEPEVYMFRNDGNGNYVNINTNLFPVAVGNATWGDFDNDGDLDVALTGKCSGCGVLLTAIYENKGEDDFEDINAGLADAEYSHVAWADFDGDSDLDLVLTGGNYNGNGFAKIYRNDLSLPNIQPETPGNLQVDFLNDIALLSWDKASDAQTPQNALTYNIRVGTSPLADDIFSAMAINENGWRKIVAPGNTGTSNFWKIEGLIEGTTYYWSVQTIDHTYQGSAFAAEQSFAYVTTGSDEYEQSDDLIVFPNPAQNQITLITNKRNDENQPYTIFNVEGFPVQKSTLTGNKIHLFDLENGTYFLKFDHSPVAPVKFIVIK
ncbi:MAG: VCBS repeat-containing protein [Bacteroidales bacterium]|nr:VCBS repeat-containing protein [Bacteroidales bacterium]